VRHIAIKAKRLPLAICAVIGLIVMSVLPLKCFLEKRFSSYQRNPVRPADFPDVLAPPETAELIDYSAPSNSHRAPDTYSLSFCLEEPYPAENAREFIRKTLSSYGWRKLAFIILAPTVRPAWLVDSTPDTVTYRWQEEWINDKGDNVQAILEYSVPQVARRDLKRLSVNLTFFGRNSWNGVLVDQYKKFHPEEFQGDGGSAAK